ncbi:MAG: hypothetical protein ACLP1D_26155 [Xanthobacteraceae bacterium]|jgi:hypothetical protein
MDRDLVKYEELVDLHETVRPYGRIRHKPDLADAILAQHAYHPREAEQHNVDKRA